MTDRPTPVPFVDAKPGDEAYTYEGGQDEYGWVTDLEWFDDRNGEMRLVRKRWELLGVDELVLPDPYAEEATDA